jgi:hypothetical protein
VPRVLYVRQDASDGTGTRAAPFGSLDDALANAATGTTVALARGAYSTTLLIPPGVTVVGACVERTVVTSGRTNAPIFETTASGVVLQNLRVSGSFLGLMVQGGSVSLRDVVFDATTGSALLLRDGAAVTAERVVVRATAAFPNGTGGRGVQVADSSLVGRQVVIEGNRELGLTATGTRSNVQLTEAVIRDTQPSADGTIGAGVNAVSSAHVELKSSVLERNSSFGVFARSGAVVSLTDVVVRDTQPLPRALPNGEHRGYGVWFQDAQVSGVRVRVEGNAHVGVLAAGGATAIGSFSDVVVRDTVWSDGAATGVFVDLGATIELQRASVLRCRPLGVEGFEQSKLRLVDLSVLDTGPDNRGVGAGGLVVDGARTMSVQRVLIARSRGAGFVMKGAVQVDGADVVVADTRVDGTGANGVAVVIGEGAQVTLDRLRVRRADVLGVILTDAQTRVTLNDAAIEDVGLQPVTEQFGQGLVVRGAATLTGTRVAIHQAHAAGVYALESARVALSELAIIETKKLACTQNCPAAAGIISTGYAAVDVSHFLVGWSEGYGVLLTRDGQLDARVGEISRTVIAAGVLVPGYDTSRIDHDVAYRANEQKLDSTEVPLPRLPVLSTVR